MMEHKCEANDGGASPALANWRPYIFWRQKTLLKPSGWYVDGFVPPIKHCPFCGLKLEPPDVKIEVSRKVLERWVAIVRGISRYLIKGPLVAARCDVNALTEWIERVLAND